MNHTSGETWFCIRYLAYRIHNRPHNIYGFEAEGLSLPMQIVPKFWRYDGMANYIRPRMSIAGLTDNYAIELFKKLFIPKMWNV